MVLSCPAPPFLTMGNLRGLASGAWQAGGRGRAEAWRPQGALGQGPTCHRWHWALCVSPGGAAALTGPRWRQPLGSPASQHKDLGRPSPSVWSGRPHRIFRPSDLIHGEVLGKGCFGQAIKCTGHAREGGDCLR